MLTAAGDWPPMLGGTGQMSFAGEFPPSWSTEGARHLAPGARVGTYIVEACLGEGGFAEVYSGHRADGGATVAIKLLKPGTESRELSARFRAEQRLLGHLSHPGIVRVMDSGKTADGRSFFVMEQVDGLPITEFCLVEQLNVRKRLELFVQVCDAVHHAHQKGVLHRDLKPSNILVADGAVPKVIDFGIAKVLDDDGSTGNTLVTRLGQVMGTPTYMAPEQAAGSDDADIRSDLYSLGAVLFEMLTGRPPFNPADLQSLPPGAWSSYLRKHEPGAPSTFIEPLSAAPVTRKDLRGDLDHVVMKAMAGEPDRRYASVEALAADVRQWLAGNGVTARPPSVAYQLQRMVRRHKIGAAMVFAALTGIVTAAVLGVLMAAQARRAERVTAGERDKAVRAERAADAARHHAEREGYQAAIQLARLQIANGEPYLAAERLRATRPSLRGWEWGYLLSAVPRAEVVLNSELPDASLLASTPDGRFVAVAGDCKVHVLDLQEKTIIARLMQPDPVAALAISGDGARLATVTYPKNATTGAVRVSGIDGTPGWEAAVTAAGDVAWEPEKAGGALLVVSGNAPVPTNGYLFRFERDTGRVLASREISRHKVAGRGITIDPSGRFAAVRRSYAVFDLVQLPGLESIATPTEGSTLLVADILFDSEKERILFAQSGNVLSCAGKTGPPQVISSLAPDNSPLLNSTGREIIRRLALLADGRWLAIGDKVDRSEGGPPNARPIVKEIQCSPIIRGRRVALLAGGFVEIRPEIVPARTPGLPVTSLTAGNEARRVALAPDASHGVFQPWERSNLTFFQPGSSGTVSLPVPAHKELEWSMLPVFHPDGSVIFNGSDSAETARFANGEISTSRLPIPMMAWSAASTPDGAYVAFGTPQGVTVLDWAKRASVRDWPISNGPFHVFAAADGVTFFALGSDAVLHHLGSVPRSTPLAGTHRRSRPPVAAFHTAQGHLAIADSDGFSIYTLNPATPPTLLIHVRTDGHPTALEFDPSGRRLAVATSERSLTLWDWEAALPLLELPIHATCAGIAFSPDGQWLAHTDFEPSVVLREALK